VPENIQIMNALTFYQIASQEVLSMQMEDRPAVNYRIRQFRIAVVIPGK
jgi:hypothetical protein